jgi:DNA-binding FrmR family transcriptional regulator
MNGLMVAVIEEHLTEHFVQEPDVEATPTRFKCNYAGY